MVFGWLNIGQRFEIYNTFFSTDSVPLERCMLCWIISLCGLGSLVRAPCGLISLFVSCGHAMPGTFWQINIILPIHNILEPK
jgi:hypothetical protein